MTLGMFNPSGVRFDPYRSYNFLISLVDSSSQLALSPQAIQSAAAAGFSECSGLETTLELEPYQEGGNNGTVLQFPTRVTWGHIRLKRGMAFFDDLWEWYYGFVEGRGRRRDGIIVLQDDIHMPVKIWQFTRGLPTKWTGPTLNATQSQVAVEELEIAHEGLKLVPFGGSASFGG
jgi:phage tail-like protein